MHLRMEQPIDAPAEVAWQILGPEFADIADWASFVRSSSEVPASEAPSALSIAGDAPVAGRETTTKATLREFITSYSHDDMSLAFDAAGLPPIVRRGRNRQSVRSTGAASSTLIFEIDFDFVGPFKVLTPIMRTRMQKSLGSVMADLKTEAERRYLATTN